MPAIIPRKFIFAQIIIFSELPLKYMDYNLYLVFQSYAAFSGVCRNKQECNEIHSYITFIPVSLNCIQFTYFLAFLHLLFGSALLNNISSTVFIVLE